MNHIQSAGRAALDFGSHARNQIESKVKKGIEVANFIVTKTDPLQKTCKVATAALALVAAVFSIFIPGSENTVQFLVNLSKAPKTTKTVIGATNVIGRFFEFTDPAARRGITKTWQKTASRIALTVGQTLETVAFVGNVASVNLGVLAANIIGNLPVINLVKGAFIIVSSGFGMWDNGNTLNAAKTTKQASNQKLDAWREISSEALREKLVAKREDNPVKYDMYISRIENDAFVKSLKDYKISKYETKIENTKKIEKKSWLAIAADIAKVAIITIGTIAMAYMVTATSFVLCTLIVAVIATSLGLAKTLYSEYGPTLARVQEFNPNLADV